MLLDLLDAAEICVEKSVGNFVKIYALGKLYSGFEKGLVGDAYVFLMQAAEYEMSI